MERDEAYDKMTAQLVEYGREAARRVESGVNLSDNIPFAVDMLRKLSDMVEQQHQGFKKIRSLVPKDK